MEALDIPEPWDFEQFCVRVAAHTGRRLRVLPVTAMPKGLCGMYVSTADTDYVYATASTTPFHREHIALHEIGHLLAGHQGGLAVADLAEVLLPDLHPALVRTVLGRTSYTDEQEREAEYFATLVAKRSRPHRAGHRADAADPAVAVVLGRLESIWGRHSVLRPSVPIETAATIRAPVGNAAGESSR
ncbi:hypothetical protein [Actinomadura opuntiae]|uniref:hypothetical protein n=1 Tax=Actinomadura sp. OS1-43 TaxID=604315 RepID=UPI00255AA4F1|nr:hypothetical protein [Actinomadura sp. OS1-43]MDL4813202.1 hypothetical protein [Actinomadura sp. OS1-43]